MTIEEAIKQLGDRVLNKYNFSDAQLKAYFQGCQDVSEELTKSLEEREKMLREFAAEASELKRLLRMAVDDLAWSNCNAGDNGECPDCPYYSGKPGRCLKEWKHAKEVEDILKK